MVVLVALWRRLRASVPPSSGSDWSICCFRCARWTAPLLLRGYPVCRRCVAVYSESGVVRCGSCAELFRYPPQVRYVDLRCPTCGWTPASGAIPAVRG